MNKEFQVHMLNDRGKEEARFIAEHFDALLESLKLHCPETREFSLCRTHLEQACFFAKKAMANAPGNTDTIS